MGISHSVGGGGEGVCWGGAWVSDYPHGGCPNSMGGVLVSWATMHRVGGSFIQGVGTTAWGVRTEVVVPVPLLLGLLGLQAQLLRGGFPWFCLLYVFQSTPFRGTDVWLSPVSWCVEQRILC